MVGNLHSEVRNLLLRRMPHSDYDRLAGDLETVTIGAREIVCEPGDDLPHVYFPTSSMLSSIVVISDGIAVEAATIGREGMGGVAVLVNERKSPYRVIQQVRGEAQRIEANRFGNALRASDSLRELVQRYVFTLLEQCGQNAACNLHHSIETRLARWLLQTSDRIGRVDFYITQEFLSEMVGASRQTISGVAGKLQQAGLIEYRRGNVRLIDRIGLEGQSCECYGRYNATYEKYMNAPIEKAV